MIGLKFLFQISKGTMAEMMLLEMKLTLTALICSAKYVGANVLGMLIVRKTLRLQGSYCLGYLVLLVDEELELPLQPE